MSADLCLGGKISAYIGAIIPNCSSCPTTFRDRTTKLPNNILGIYEQRWVSMGTIIPVFLP